MEKWATDVNMSLEYLGDQHDTFILCIEDHIWSNYVGYIFKL